MSVLINADTSDGLKITSDTSGEVKLQSAGADIATVNSSGITMASGKTLPASSLTGTVPAGVTVNSSSLSGNLPALNGSAITNLTSANLTGALPAIDGSALTGIEAGQVLEYITGVCDGTTVTTPHDTYTLTNVAARQTLSTSYAVVNGSSIAYTPPANTKKVLYRFSFMNSFVSNHAIEHFRFYINSTEVTMARFNNATANAKEILVNFEWVMDIGNSNTSTTGRFTSWTTDKTLQLRARSYAAGNTGSLHDTYYWDGAASRRLHKPILTIIALG